MPHLGLEVPRADMDALFESWDPDGSNSIELKELSKILRRPVQLGKKLRAGAVDVEVATPRVSPRAAAAAARLSSKATASLAATAIPVRTSAGRKTSIRKLDLDETSEKSYAQQLQEHLCRDAVRVIDLFRDWDDDGNGKVDKKEFRKAMKALGLDVPRKEVDGLFDSFDPDGGGSIEYNELNKALKRKVALDPSMQAGAVPIELKARQPPPDS